MQHFNYHTNKPISSFSIISHKFLNSKIYNNSKINDKFTKFCAGEKQYFTDLICRQSICKLTISDIHQMSTILLVVPQNEPYTDYA